MNARDIVRAVAERRLEPGDVVEACLARIALAEPELAAFAHLDAEAVRAAARAAPRDGRLAGLPIGVKDIFDTADMPTALGSPIHAGRRPGRDAAAVAALRAAGGVVVGKTHTTEFAYAHPAPTRNPRNPGHTPGGSSSGSAAAVAAGLVPLALGTQTAGSVIRPAAFCGVPAFKPSFGLIGRAGIQPFAESLDTVGVFAASLGDAALLAGVLAGRDDIADALPCGAPPRLGLCRTADWQAAEPAARDVLEEAAGALRAAGAGLADVALPPGDLAAIQSDIMAFEGASALGYEAAAHGERLSPVLAALIEEGRALGGAHHARRLGQAAEARRGFAQIAATFDAVLTLSAPGEAPEGLGHTGDARFNRVWTLLHGPAVHLPVASGPRGLPLGIQITGPWLADARVLSAALWIERALA